MRTLLIASIVFAATGQAIAKPCIASTRADLVGAWVAQAQVDTYLLDLDANGHGWLAHAFGQQPHATYKVELARLDGQRIEFRVTTIAGLSKALYLRGTTCRGYLWLEIGERSPKWKDSLEFRPRDALLSDIEALTATAERLKENKPQ
jgi:hypothetical protein